MDDLISRRALCEYALNQKDKSVSPNDIMRFPSAQPERMHTVMLKIAEKYEKAMNAPCILNPMAWALYQTWKEYDR